MSMDAIRAVRDAEIRPSGRKFVAMALADYADESWSCFPSVSLLAKYTSQGISTVREHLAALEAEEIIKRIRIRRGDGTLTVYRYFIQRQNLAVGAVEVQEATAEIHPAPDFASAEIQHPPPPDSGAQEPPNLTLNNNNGKTRTRDQFPIPENWEPRAEETRLALDDLKFTPEELSDAAAEFRAFWRDQSGSRSGRKSDWDRTFRNRLRELAARWRTAGRTSFAGQPGRKRQGGSSLADAAARLYSQGG